MSQLKLRKTELTIFFDFLTIFLKTNDVRCINMYDHILGGVAVYRFFGKEKKHSDS